MRVLFVVMPFGAIRPAIGVSLLKSHLTQMGVPSKVLYLNMRLALRLGLEDYEFVAERAPSQSLAGDWVFSASLSGQRDSADAEYLKDYARRFSCFTPADGPLAILKRSRPHAEAYLNDCLSSVDWNDYDVVGFTSTFSQHAASLALARRLKERFPRLLIAFGGANCEDVMGLQAHRSFPFIDFVCSSEADISFPRLIGALRDGGDVGAIPGVVSRRDGASHFTSLAPERVEQLDSLPTPDYADYFEQLKQLGARPRNGSGVLMESSRGCWWGEKHHCTFCGLNGTFMAFRSKSERRVLEELAELRDRYQTRYVEMVDNILDMKYFRSLIPELARQQLKLGLFYETKSNLTKAQLRLMRDAGITIIQPGIESLSSDVLRLMRKGTSAIQNVQMLKWCKEYGIDAHWNLIFGFPGENPGDYEAGAATMEFLHHLRPPYGVGMIRLDRFSPNFNEAERFGIVNVRPDRSYRHIYQLPDPELFELAYFFEHDYADGRNPESYVAGFRQAVRRWYEEDGSRGLVYADHGHDLAIWDLRPNARRRLTILSGHERAIYRFCDQHRSLQQIEALPEVSAAATSIQPFLEGLIASRMMLRLDDRYLSLAIAARADAAEPEPAPPVLAKPARARLAVVE